MKISTASAIRDPRLLGPAFRGPSWDRWCVVLKASDAEPLTEAELVLFQEIAGGRPPPTAPVKELWAVVGRRGGKDSIASAVAAVAALGDYSEHLRPGERATVMCLACDRDQAKIVLRYIRGYFETNDLLRPLVARETDDGLELINGVDVVVATNSFRSVRGRTVICAILDEAAYWRDERSAAPDFETYHAVLPGLATLPNAKLIGISTPYRRSGLLFERWRTAYGIDDPDVLVVKGASRQFNPTLPQAIIDKALERDPEAAASEWLAEWRTDLSDFIDRAAVDAATIPDRRELPPTHGTLYRAFCDPSGGSSDSFTLAVAHRDQEGKGVLDCVREIRPPFSPDAACAEFSDLLRSYNLTRVEGDRYGGLWPRERFQVHGISYDCSELVKSALYLELLPLLNSGRIELLDHPRLISQLCSLERRTARSGKDSVDHPVGAHDDLVNAAAGALVAVAGRASGLEVWRKIAENAVWTR